MPTFGAVVGTDTFTNSESGYDVSPVTPSTATDTLQSAVSVPFGSSPENFGKACRSLGGTPAESSGCAYDIPFLPELTVRLVVWPAEEDFPPSAQFLFSSNFSLAFSAEDLAYCGDVLLDALKGRI